MKQTALRYGILIGLFISTSIFPWWAVFALSAIAAFLIEDFFELIVIGLFYDIRFHMPGAHWYMSIIHTVILVVIVVVAFFIQKITRRPSLL